MSQKIQFIIAVISKPRLLILDEPFSGLDPISAQLLKDAIAELKRDGVTIIFSTHQMEQVEQLCDDICLMNKGRKVLGGRLRDVKQSFGTGALILDFHGSDSFLNNGIVKAVNRFPGYIEVKLKEGADAQDLLKRALSEGVRINRFEMVEASLNDIFISTIGETR
jgi:ABC-2 type transport system ATP-binding protein